MGRCAQDDYYLVPISENDLPAEFLRRAGKRVEEVIPLFERKLLVAFRDGTVRKCDMTAYFSSHRSFEILLNHPEYMAQVKVQVGGHGIMWDENLTIPAHELYRMGKKVPLTLSQSDDTDGYLVDQDRLGIVFRDPERFPAEDRRDAEKDPERDRCPSGRDPGGT